LGCGTESGLWSGGFHIVIGVCFLLRSSVKSGPAAREDLDLCSLFPSCSTFILIFFLFSFFPFAIVLYFVFYSAGLHWSPIFLSPYRTYPCLFTFHSYRCLLFPSSAFRAHVSLVETGLWIVVSRMFRWGGRSGRVSQDAMASCCKYTRT
jgi:hypothetical protein